MNEWMNEWIVNELSSVSNDRIFVFVGVSEVSCRPKFDRFSLWVVGECYFRTNWLRNILLFVIYGLWDSFFSLFSVLFVCAWQLKTLSLIWAFLLCSLPSTMFIVCVSVARPIWHRGHAAWSQFRGSRVGQLSGLCKIMCGWSIANRNPVVLFDLCNPDVLMTNSYVMPTMASIFVNNSGLLNPDKRTCCCLLNTGGYSIAPNKWFTVIGTFWTK